VRISRIPPEIAFGDKLEAGRFNITPNGLHFEGHHAGVPVIDPDRGK
jgi:hypothetical protein